MDLLSGECSHLYFHGIDWEEGYVKTQESGMSLISCGTVILEENRNLSCIFANVPEEDCQP